jgi:Fur family peroxide stress response transcriptional regulator
MRARTVDRSDAMLAQLKRAGCRLTPQRIAIVREIAGDLSHPTAQALYERLRPSFPTMSFATVYNTLEALTRARLTGELRLGGAVRFDPNVSPHHHAVCDACGAIEDIPAERPAKRVGRVGAFRVRVEERTYRGLCARCSSIPKTKEA